MIRWMLLFVWGLLLLSSLVQGGDATACSLYLAKSSIPNAGWGVFAGRDYKQGERIGHPSIGIPFSDRNMTADAAAALGSLTEFLWDASDIGGFDEALDVELFLPGSASMINHHAFLDNVVVSGLTHDEPLQRGYNPMAGSYTAYHELVLIAKKDIQAGQELFVDQTRRAAYPRKIKDLPSTEDYTKADAIVQQLANVHLELTDAQWTDLLYRMKHEIMEESDKGAIKVFPNTRQQFQRAVEFGTAGMELQERNMDWIQSNGQCIDTIKQGTSTLADAGRGAFATRDFSKGSIVTVAPLVTINDKKLAMQTNNRTSALPWEVSPQQLLLNYCFGHAKAELLLCPASHAAMINHDPKEPNLEIRWARTGQREHDYTSGLKQELLEMDSNDMQSYNSKIMLEYVAIGDIRAGEELFLNYGQEWEDALQNHLAHGVSKAADVELVSAKQLNQENATLEVSTSEAMKNHSYLCSIYPNVKIGEVNANWEEFSSNRAVDKASWPTDLKALYQHNDFAGLYPCRVVEADNIQKLYSIEMFIKPLSRNFVGRRYHNVPRNRIRFSDNLYRSDQHLSWAFRHYIPIPDSIFPLRWRDDYKPASYWSLGKDARVQGTQNIAEGYELAARNAKCGVYIAPSNIPNAGFGTYTAIDIPAGALVVASSMPVIPEMTGPKSNKAPVRRWPGRDYVWGGHQFGASNEAHPIWSTSMLAVMFGSLANAHTGITNLYQDSGKYEPVLDRREDPGAGASSDYIGYSFRSAYPVPAGEELFVSYGEQWFVQRKQFNDVPLKKHFMHANDILAAIWSLVALDDAAVQGRNIPILLQVIRDRVIDQPRTRSALSSIKTPDDLRHIVGRNGTAQATVEAKSINWLEKYGYCQDHIFAKRSTIQQAGQGAFSRRFLPKGTLVISAPTIATDRYYMHLNTTMTKEEINPQELMINYHWGHKNSSILFFPLNHAFTINHNSKRKISGKEPNVRVEFSSREKRSRYFRERSLEDLRKEKYSTIVLDFIAIRDIYPDEEIFLDYGKDWEDAWDAHVNSWKNPCGSAGLSSLFSSSSSLCTKSSKLIHQMNNDKFNTAYHAWSDDHITTCRPGGGNLNLGDPAIEYIFLTKTIPKEFSLAVDPQIKQEYEGITYNNEGFKIAVSDSRPCKIVQGRKNSDEFDVIFFFDSRHLPRDKVKAQDAHVLIPYKNLEAKYVRFQSRPFKSDMLAPTAFRHEIAIPDERFPPLWKDLE